MKKQILLIIVTLLCAGCTSVKKNWIAVCGDGVIRIIDMAKSDSTNIEEVWRWDKDDPQVNLPKGYDKYMRNLDECKFVDNNTKMLLTASGDGMMLLDIETKDILCYAHVPMAHSADLLPNNRIAVALSTHKKGNALEIYDIDQPEKVMFRDSLYSVERKTSTSLCFGIQRTERVRIGGLEYRQAFAPTGKDVGDSDGIGTRPLASG